MYGFQRRAGGMLRYALPEYRLPREVVRREVELNPAHGRELRPARRGWGRTSRWTSLDSEYNAVFLAIGAWREPWGARAGTDLNGVMPALSFLEEVAKDQPAHLGPPRGGSFGAGNGRRGFGAHLVCAWARSEGDLPARAQRHARHPRGDGSGPARRRQVRLPGPRRTASWATRTATSKAIEVVKTKLGEFDSSGRRRPVLTEEIRRFECDSVILAGRIGWTRILPVPRASSSTRTARWRWTVTRSRPAAARFYAGGDLISGASNVSNSMGFGKKARRATSTRG